MELMDLLLLELFSLRILTRSLSLLRLLSLTLAVPHCSLIALSSVPLYIRLSLARFLLARVPHLPLGLAYCGRSALFDYAPLNNELCSARLLAPSFNVRLADAELVISLYLYLPAFIAFSAAVIRMVRWALRRSCRCYYAGLAEEHPVSHPLDLLNDVVEPRG